MFFFGLNCQIVELIRKTLSFFTAQLCRVNNAYKENDFTKKIIDQLIIISEEVGITPGQVAFALILSKDAFPIVGARAVSHLNDTLKAISVQLTADQITNLDELSSVSLGYPNDLLQQVRG
ncbi:aldo/keto reductase [Flavobacterium sp. MMLR14_040]|uniref:aldo/keto reductase n=1 Tax=Flavobacterium sp. MMLR14_040 TaxID=3093843 RepID=UPI002990713E|nr:aldo/keto reductase [Flavobacterium sp. MMLR14_040]MDW8850728.1 aldo/keto reductase [Flavobacterium sp. MMLR14_040]